MSRDFTMDKRRLKFASVSLLLILMYSSAAQAKSEGNVSKFFTEEIAALTKTTKCNLQALSRKTLQDKWLKDKHVNQVSGETFLCVLNWLQSHTEDALIWSVAGSAFDYVGSKRKADFCFKQSSKLMGKHSLFIKEWSYLAPFTVGKSEFDGDPLVAAGGIESVSVSRFSSKSPKFYSELMSVLTWSSATQSKEGAVVQIRPNLEWNDLISALGSLGITEWQGWAVGDLIVNEDNIPLAFQCLGVARCAVANVTLAGDLYHRDILWTPVKLKRGVHPVYIPLKTKVAASFKFSVSSRQPKFQLLQPSFLPDIYDGFIVKKAYISVIVSNLMSEEWINIRKVEIADQSFGERIECQLLRKINHVAPGQTQFVNIELLIPKTDQVEESSLTETCQDISFDLKVKTSHGTETLNLKLRCRSRGSSFLFTYLDHDGSVQHAAAIEPLQYCTEPCPVVLSLHGTTVPPQNQADSYKKMVDGEFEFGINGMWLLAPTRHGAHNWEGPGCLTAMTALNALMQISQDKSVFKYEADENKVIFAGHSMGGHGAWHLASHFPDRAIGLVSLAGWIKKEDYGDSNLFFKHDVSTSYADPSVKVVMEACTAENDVDKHASNLKGIPVLARIGRNDRTVHPYFVRRMVRVLNSVGVDVTFSELPGLEHWWWDTKETNDGGCVNDKQIRNFFEKILKDKKASMSSNQFCTKDDTDGCSEMQNHETFTLVTYNPALGEGLKGVSVFLQEIPFRMSTVKIQEENGLAILETYNVKCLKIERKISDMSWSIADYSQIIIDGVDLSMASHYCKNDQGHWTEVRNDELPPLHVRRTPSNLGPARRIAEKPFIIIYGTKCDTRPSSILLEHSVYIANHFFATSDASVAIVKDQELEEMVVNIESTNLIIIGGPEENSAAAQYINILPDLEIKNFTSLRLGSCLYSQSRTGILTLAPGAPNHNPDGLVLLLMGLSPAGLADVVHMATPTIPPMARSPFSNMVPDFVITGPETGFKGPGGFLCAGFWSNDWTFSHASASCAC